MKKLFASLGVAIVLANPAPAQDQDGSSLMERGAQQFLEGLLQEMQPAWEHMQGFMDEMGPAMLELMEEIKDWSVYDAPEILENGDIIIRRKPPEEDDVIPQTDPSDPIEL